MIKGLIFDYGGTLDTNGCHWGMMIWHAYERQGVPVDEGAFRDAYVYTERMLGKNRIIDTADTFLTVLTKKITIQMDYLQVEGYVEAVVSDLYGLVQIHTTHAVRVLKELSRCYPLVLVSNFYGNMQTVLEEFGFRHLFSQVIESAVVGIRKPDPQIFKLGVDALGFSPDEVAVIGDSVEKDMTPARCLGCHTIWIQGEGWSPHPSDLSAVDVIITDLQELLTLR